jgi:membrane protein DedA with SNARE-associated domain
VLAHPPLLALHLHHHLRGSSVSYFGVAIAAAIGAAGVPGPGEALLIAAGVAASRGRLDIVAVLAVSVIGSLAGGIGGWAIGRFGGRRVVLAGRFLRAHRERALDHGNSFFQRYGILAVYLAPSWAAGINAMHLPRFVVASAICAIVWTLQYGMGAYLLGPSVTDLAQDVGTGAAIAAAVAIVGGALLTRRSLRRRRAARTALRDPS